MNLVADAAHVQPISTPKFPANREKNREFCKGAGSVRHNAHHALVLTTAWRIAHDPKRHLYVDQALTAVLDDEDETFDYLTKTDGAKAAIDHIKKVAELTSVFPPNAASISPTS